MFPFISMFLDKITESMKNAKLMNVNNLCPKRIVET